MTHTKGPWTFESFSFGSRTAPVCHKAIVGPPHGPHGAQHLIAEIHTQHNRHEADARLIAAAPDLLEALEEIVSEADQSNGGKGARLPIVLHIRGIAIAAIKKARG